MPKQSASCECNVSSHIVDSGFYSSGYTTAEAREIFCDIYRYQRWLDVEATLAMAQGELGLIPVKAAENIRDNAWIKTLDLDAIRYRQFYVCRKCGATHADDACHLHRFNELFDGQCLPVHGGTGVDDTTATDKLVAA